MNQVQQIGPTSQRALRYRDQELIIGERTLIMGILNVTPDSFSDGGQYIQKDHAIRQALRMQEEGADLLDIGGESTRPGASPVSLTEELDRIVPLVEALSKETNLPISVDTYKSQVAEEALKAGAHMINDVWGGQKDERILSVVASYGVPYILMHNRVKADYHDFIPDFITDLKSSIETAKSYGVKDEQILLDPGIGFGKTYEQNILIMNQLDCMTPFGYPILLGTSRKSMIGLALDLPVKERLEGTLATLCLGMMKGCDIVRVHDVKEAVRCCRMMDAMIRTRR
jgi:dihydropteroate synthase